MTEPRDEPTIGIGDAPDGTSGTARPGDDQSGPGHRAAEDRPDRPDARSTIRPAWTVAAVVIVLALVVLAAAYIPRTLVEGGEETQTWRLTVTPGIVSPSVRLVTADGAEQRAGGFGLRPPLDATRVWTVPLGAGGAPTTIVVGPTPAGTDSVRVTSDVRGVGEATVRQVGWRRVHVAVIHAEASILELVAISEGGRVLETVFDLGSSAPAVDATGTR